MHLNVAIMMSVSNFYDLRIIYQLEVTFELWTGEKVFIARTWLRYCYNIECIIPTLPLKWQPIRKK